MENTIVTI